MAERFRVINPHYPGSVARMSDGRTFTRYLPSSRGLGPNSLETKQRLQATGEQQMKADRSLLTMMVGTVPCDSFGLPDTMVPEQTKRICTWEGCSVLPAHQVGIGQGRLYLPARSELAWADPDITALEVGRTATHNAFSALPRYAPGACDAAGSLVTRPSNRYSLPYAVS
jgi:hypothetical protein